jgi:cytochrome b6-f complex iron-sulfur subunit
MNRREFMGWVGVGCMASSLPVAIAACSNDASNNVDSSAPAAAPDSAGNEPTAPETASSGGFTQVATVAQLDTEGSVLNLDGYVPVIVVRDPDTNAIAAYDPTCPHKQCKVSWKPEEQAMVCPCHDSKFAAADGAVLMGPAQEPLTKLEFQETDGNILVNLS